MGWGCGWGGGFLFPVEWGGEEVEVGGEVVVEEEVEEEVVEVEVEVVVVEEEVMDLDLDLLPQGRL